jgi:hypothetical protein
MSEGPNSISRKVAVEVALEGNGLVSCDRFHAFPVMAGFPPGSRLTRPETSFLGRFRRDAATASAHRLW